MTPISTPASNAMSRWVLLALLWQAFIALVGVAGLINLFTNPDASEIGSLFRVIVMIVLAIMSLASFISLPAIHKRQHRGRVIALVLNYLIFLALFFYTLHLLGIFVGIDNLATTFSRGLPFLAAAFFTYLIIGRFENSASLQAYQRLIYGLILLLLGLALFAMGLVAGIQSIGEEIIANPTTLGLTVATILFGLMTWLWWHEKMALAFGATISQSQMLDGYLFLSPNLLGFLIFFAGPLLFSFYVSLTEWSAFGDKQWVGLANYQEIFSFDFATLADSNQRASEVLASRFVELTRFNLFGEDIIIGAKDKLFWIALRNTIMFCLMVVPLSVIPALFLANILNSKIPGMRFFRALYFIPSVAAVVGVAVIWNWLYNSTVGFINYGITNLIEFINILPGLTLTDPQIRWLSSSNTALFAIVLMSAWRIVGFNTVLFLAGLQGIPREIYEAAEVDGASTWRKFRSITIPLLAPTTFFVLTTTIIQALQVFDEVFVLMNPPAGPNNSTLTAVLYLYQNGFQRFNLGYASAVAWALFVIIFIVTLIQFRMQRE